MVDTKLRTPYFVIDKEALDNNYFKMVDAIKNSWDNYVIGYSYKTNSLPWIIKHFDDLGAYSEVVSEDELKLALKVGIDNKRIIYNGPIKTKETFINSLNSGAIVNIDSQREIDWLDCVSNKNCRLGIRVNFNIERMCPGQSQCPEDGGRFGFCFENGELEKAINKIKDKGFNIKGLHLHTSSKTRGLDIYEAISNIACEVKEKFNLNLSFIDIGGGFFGGLTNKPQFNEYFSLVFSVLSKHFSKENTTLIIEPGMALIGAPISYITSVIDVKDTELNRFVITDGTRTHIDPLMNKKSYFKDYEYISNSNRIKKHKQIICGYTCMEHDRLFESIDEMELFVGDRIIYEKVGAYTMCLTPLFIKYFPDVYVEENGKLNKVRESWTPEEYIQLCKY